MKLFRIGAFGVLSLTCLSGSLEAHSSLLPLGDGKVSATPERGHVMQCRRWLPRLGPRLGAHQQGEWIKDGRWNPAAKPVVEGNVPWPDARIEIVVEGGQRLIRTNGLPKHGTGVFPIAKESHAYAYDRNPNAIRRHSILYRLPLTPEPAASPVCVGGGPVGFTLSGAALFSAFDAEDRDAPAHEIQDACNGHPEERGLYHYHNWSPCLKADHPDEPVGWAIDGFPILGPQDAAGKVITNADLDACHGREGPVRINGQTQTLYHYRFTMEFPYSIGCFRGQPRRRE